MQATDQTLVIGVVDGDRGEVVAFGKLNNGKPADGDTVYEIGSITKTFTATLLAQAVLAGQVTLETPVDQLLPGFKVPSREGKKITLGELATQYSGLPRDPSDLLLGDLGNPYAHYSLEKLMAFLAGYELPRDPGASYEYSNLEFGLLGVALSRLASVSYGTLIDAQIFKPLNMTMSSTKLTDAMRAHLAPGHDDKGNSVKNWAFDALEGAGAVHSTCNDMLRYLRANVGVDQSPTSAAMELAQRPRRNMGLPARMLKLRHLLNLRGSDWLG